MRTAFITLFPTLIAIISSSLTICQVRANAFQRMEEGVEAENDDLRIPPLSITRGATGASSSGEEAFSSDFQLPLPSFVESILPSFGGDSSKSDPQMNRSSLSHFMSRLFSNVIIDGNSISQIQYYNAGTILREEESNASSPNAVFGSPLCLGLCMTSQVYSENASIRLFSDKQFSLVRLSSSSNNTNRNFAIHIDAGLDDQEVANNSSSKPASSSIIANALQWPSTWASWSTPSVSLPTLRFPAFSGNIFG